MFSGACVRMSGTDRSQERHSAVPRFGVEELCGTKAAPEFRHWVLVLASLLMNRWHRAEYCFHLDSQPVQPSSCLCSVGLEDLRGHVSGRELPPGRMALHGKLARTQASEQWESSMHWP